MNRKREKIFDNAIIRDRRRKLDMQSIVCSVVKSYFIQVKFFVDFHLSNIVSCPVVNLCTGGYDLHLATQESLELCQLGIHLTGFMGSHASKTSNWV